MSCLTVELDAGDWKQSQAKVLKIRPYITSNAQIACVVTLAHGALAGARPAQDEDDVRAGVLGEDRDLRRGCLAHRHAPPCDVAVPGLVHGRELVVVDDGVCEVPIELGDLRAFVTELRPKSQQNVRGKVSKDSGESEQRAVSKSHPPGAVGG